MGHDGHGVGMDEVQQVEAGKRKRQGPQQCGVAPRQPATQQQIAAGEHQRIADEQFQVEGHAQRQKAVEGQMKRVIGAGLSFAGEIKSTEQRGKPIERFAGLQLLGIERPQRQMKRTQIVGHVDTAGQQRNGHRQRTIAQQPPEQPGEQPSFGRRRWCRWGA